ncbi:MAG: S1C family serine protease, partial [Cyclobacteriaceae bacterium]|nr:S1C family serine protease [Cyclobacteriaceae bacterium]
MKKVLTILLVANLAVAVSSCEGQVKQTGASKEVYSIVAKQLQAGLDTGSLKAKNNSGIDFREAARKVTPCVVHVNSKWNAPEDQQELKEDNPFRDFFGDEFWGDFFRPFRPHGPRQGTASGVILTSDGYIVTNNHVIEDADEIEVVLHDQRSYRAKIVGADPKTDLALLKIDETNLSFL